MDQLEQLQTRIQQLQIENERLLGNIAELTIEELYREYEMKALRDVVNSIPHAKDGYMTMIPYDKMQRLREIVSGKVREEYGP